MNEAEKFYRKEFPKVKELTYLDSEIIRLLNLYKKEQVKKLTLTDVVSSKRFEEKDLLIAYQNGYIENGCIDYVLNFDERMDLLKNAEKWIKSYKK